VWGGRGRAASRIKGLSTAQPTVKIETIGEKNLYKSSAGGVFIYKMPRIQS
jgi:hypothetical protein